MHIFIFFLKIDITVIFPHKLGMSYKEDDVCVPKSSVCVSSLQALYRGLKLAWFEFLGGNDAFFWGGFIDNYYSSLWGNREFHTLANFCL